MTSMWKVSTFVLFFLVVFGTFSFGVFGNAIALRSSLVLDDEEPPSDPQMPNTCGGVLPPGFCDAVGDHDAHTCIEDNDKGLDCECTCKCATGPPCILSCKECMKWTGCKEKKNPNGEKGLFCGLYPNDIWSEDVEEGDTF